MTVVIIELVVLVSLGGIGDGRGGLDGCDERNFSFGVVVVVVIVGGGRCCRGDGDCDRGGAEWWLPVDVMLSWSLERP